MEVKQSSEEVVELTMPIPDGEKWVGVFSEIFRTISKVKYVNDTVIDIAAEVVENEIKIRINFIDSSSADDFRKCVNIDAEIMIKKLIISTSPKKKKLGRAFEQMKLDGLGIRSAEEFGPLEYINQGDESTLMLQHPELIAEVSIHADTEDKKTQKLGAESLRRVKFRARGLETTLQCATGPKGEYRLESLGYDEEIIVARALKEGLDHTIQEIHLAREMQREIDGLGDFDAED